MSRFSFLFLEPIHHCVFHTIQDFSLFVAKSDGVEIPSALHRAHGITCDVLPLRRTGFVETQFVAVDPHTVCL